MDPNERLLLSNGEAVSLTPRVFETLLVLVENAGRLVPKSGFMKRVWPDASVEDVALSLAYVLTEVGKKVLLISYRAP